MDVDQVPTSPTGRSSVAREKTAPFLIRTFVKIGSFHRLTLFEDGSLPTTDEQQLFTWKDATLREVLTTLRNTAPHVPEYRHPLARFSFRTVYADPGNKGRFSSKDLGQVYSRDILGEPGTLTTTAPRFLEDMDNENRDQTEREREERSLEEWRFVPGDYMLVAVILPRNMALPSEVGAKGVANGWKSGRENPGPGPGAPGFGRGGGGHWRGDPSGAPVRGGRGRGERERDSDRSDRRAPPPRRGSPPSRGDGGWGGRGGRAGGSRRSPRSHSRSRSPPRKRR
ncbi:hypothetical protein E1B28_004838 [Marasmius oreades]|uniref:Sin3 associated polypeptide p18 n=1 Tax=Marasmius oreades TaxID=181124 RepID=A0A9P8AD81_9AGAR|nr:uncharacterized protein E1B28_004838 [Marasmius oreades]KAG7097496.1 hypothetical protein E1B28_004838 [Marasmius oreades]